MKHPNKMKENNKQKIIVILGPTASGKSDLAVALALKYNGEIISADSRQIYRNMDIGTGKITKKEMRGIPHYLLDIASPKTQLSVAHFQKQAKIAIEKILAKGKAPIICGGTGLYIDAVIDNQIFPDVKPNFQLRKKLEKLTNKELFTKLKKLDPNRAKNIDKHNPRRLIRALEIVIISKKPVPKIQKHRDYDVLKLGVKRDQKQLNELIWKRLLKRLKGKMINEIKKLTKSGVSFKRLYDFGLEYRWISLYLQKKVTKEQMIQRLYKAIKDFSKRQMTWFKRDSEIHWIKNQKEAERLIKNFLNQKTA
jgi:tRNA dimethylallyltransferase